MQKTLKFLFIPIFFFSVIPLTCAITFKIINSPEICIEGYGIKIHAGEPRK